MVSDSIAFGSPASVTTLIPAVIKYRGIRRHIFKVDRLTPVKADSLDGDRDTRRPNMENNSDFDDLQPVERRWFRTIVKSVVAVLILLLVAAGIVYWLAIQPPDFYQASVRISEEESLESGESFEIAGLYLRNDMVEEETWYAEFFEAHINGWLASDLPRKFATALPDNMREPRVKIEPEKFQVGAATEILGIETVLIAAIDFFPTESTNEFGLRVLSVHAGQMPIPVSFFNQLATELFQKYQIRVRWYDDDNGMPVAVLTLPKDLLSYQGKQMVLEQLEFVDGSVRLAGRSEAIEKKEQSESIAAEPKSEHSNAENEVVEPPASEPPSELPVSD